MELIVNCRNKQELIDLEKFLNRYQILKITDQISDLTEDTEELQPYAPLLSEEVANLNREIVYRRLAIRDLNVPSVELMREIQQVIAEALEKGHVVYAHCWGGIGRTGTVIGCYLVEQGMSGEEALAEIERLRRNTPDGHRVSPETAAQTAFVKHWRQ